MCISTEGGCYVKKEAKKHWAPSNWVWVMEQGPWVEEMGMAWVGIKINKQFLFPFYTKT